MELSIKGVINWGDFKLYKIDLNWKEREKNGIFEKFFDKWSWELN